MAQSLKDKVMLKTIKEWASITGYSDEEILRWPVKKLHEMLKQAQGTAGPYWRIFLRKLKTNLETRYWEMIKESGDPASEVLVMQWPEALEKPQSDAADAELDDVADQIRVLIG